MLEGVSATAKRLEGSRRAEAVIVIALMLALLVNCQTPPNQLAPNDLGPTGYLRCNDNRKLKMNTLGKLPFPSTSCDWAETRIGTDLVVKFDYPTADARLVEGELRFIKVRAYRGWAERYATVDDIHGAYDSLVEIEDSTWVRSLREASHGDSSWVLRHFATYLDFLGRLEVVAEDWQLVL